MKLIFSIIVLVFAIGVCANAKPEEPRKVTVTVFPALDKIVTANPLPLLIKISVAPGWHINSNKPKENFLIPSVVSLLDTSVFTLSDIKYPQAREVKLAFSDVPLSVFEGDVYITAKLKLKSDKKPGQAILKLLFDYQACNNANCIAPSREMAVYQLWVAVKGETVNAINQDIFTEVAQLSAAKKPGIPNDSMLEKLKSHSFAFSLLLLFVLGLGLNLTPCVYPLIPITIGFFGGQSEGRTSRLAIMGGLYLLGISLTYSIIGVVTALSGTLFGALLQNPYVVLFIVLIFFLLSLSMFGLYDIKVPDFLMKKLGTSPGGYFGAFFMGLTMGIVAAPCIGPVVVSLVTIVAAEHDPLLGFLRFFFLSIGLGAPYFVLALFSGKIKQLPRAGLWMESVKHIFGLVMLGLAIYYVVPLLPEAINPFALPIFIFLSGLYLLLFENAAGESTAVLKGIAAKFTGFEIFRIILSVVIIAVGIYLMYPSNTGLIAWKPYSQEELSKAGEAGKPVIIDFYAEWCIPCKELDKMTFSNPAVIDESARFVRLKVDLTSSTSEAAVNLIKTFNITGVPTVVIFDASGNEVERITKFVPADEFLKSLVQVK